MKKMMRILSLAIAATLLLVMTVCADEGNAYSSLFFASYDSFIYIPSGRTLEIWFDVVGNGAMDEIGVSYIELERSSDGRNWTVVKTFLPESYPQMIIEDTGINYDCVSYLGAYGYYYRAYVTFYAKNSRGRGNEYQYSETVYITPPAGFIP